MVQIQTVVRQRKQSDVFKFIEDAGYIFDQGTIPAGSQANGSANFDIGTVLGRVSSGTISVGAPAAGSGNTGNGTCTLSAPAYDDGVQPGAYEAVAIAAGEFEVFDPSGRLVGIAADGVAFADQLHFTIAAGGTAFAVGDTFSIAVTAAAGSGKFVQLNFAGLDGSQNFAGIVARRVTVDGATDTPATILARGPATVVIDNLTWPTGISAAQQAAALAQAAAVGIKGAADRLSPSQKGAPPMSKSKPPTAAECAAEFSKQSGEINVVDALLATRDSERLALLLSGSDSDVMAFDRKTQDLRLRRERAIARAKQARDDHARAAEAELEQAKAALRAEAEGKRKSATDAYLRAESKLRDLFAADLAEIFAADAAIANSNANLPAGAEPLRPVEADLRWLDGIASTTELVPRSTPADLVTRTITALAADALPPTVRVIPGRSAVRPEPLYQVLACPALRPGDSPLRVSGTPLPSSGHAVTVLKKPAAALPAAATSVDAMDAAQMHGSLAKRVHGHGR